MGVSSIYAYLELTGASKIRVEGRQKKFVASHKFVARKFVADFFWAKKITPDFSGAIPKT
jgi:hypothetical protein